jgi:MerR family transcriptional regulator, light-induced transcriptional regulator
VQERVVNELVQEMVDLDIEKFEKILTGFIAAKGIEKTVIQIIFPFLEKIGLLWQTGHINPAQEHLVSNIIRQKLIVAIETTTSSVKINKSFLLYLPEGEHHELGLLFMYYLLKSRGAKTIYLGANVPLKDVEHVVRLKSPDIVFIHLTAGPVNFNFEKFIRNIEQRLGNVTTVISGQSTLQYKRKLPDCIHLKRSLTEVMDYLSSL